MKQLFPSSMFNIFTSLQGEPGLGERLLIVILFNI